MRGWVRAGGGARGRSLSLGRGTFSENRPPARASRGLAPRPSSREGVGKVALGARDGLGAAQILWFFSPRLSGPLAARPPRADSNLPPGPQCKPPREGPGSHLREVQLSPRAGSPGAGLQLAAGRLRGAGGCPSSRAGRWAVPWWGRVRAAKFLGRGGRPCKLCRAVTARWPLSARCPRRAGSPCGGRTRKPLRVIPARGSSPPAPVSRFPARVRALRSPRLLPAGQMGRACFGLELEPPELPGCRSLVNLSFC